MVLPLLCVVQVVTNPIGAFLQKKLNNKVILTIGSIITITGVFLSSFMKSLGLFVLFYCVMFPAGIGLCYFTPLICGWEWLPHRKGFVTGMIVGGFGFGTFIFAYISTALVNPHNAKPVLMPNGNKLYEWDVA